MVDAGIPGKMTFALLIVLVVLLALQTLALVSIRSRLADAERARGEAEEALEAGLREAASGLDGAAAKLDGAAARLAASLAESARRQDGPAEAFLEAALLLARSGDASTRCAATRVLKDIQDERAEARLVEMAAKDTSQYARNEAVSALAESGSPQLADVMKQAWDRGGMDEGARRHYVRRLRQVGNRTACGLLLYVMHSDPNRDVINEAAQYLVEIVTRRDSTILGKAADILRARERDHSSEALGTVVEAIGRMDDIRVTEHVIPCLAHPDTEVARRAARALGRLKDPLAARPLVEALGNEGLRETLVEVLTEGYPGVRRDDGGAFALVDDDELKALLTERERKAERRIEEIKRLDEEVEVF